MLTPEQYGDELYAKDEVLERVTQSIADSGMRDVSIAPGYGRLLTLLVKLAGAKAVLEIGALGGYSGICLARGLPADGRLLSLELKEENAELARANLHEAGFEQVAGYMVGPALDSLQTLEQRGERFDFFFIDADKENYPNYLEYAIKLANPGALIAGDNILLRGRTLNEDKNGPSVQAMRRFNETIARDERLISTLLPAYDGLALAMVK
ncbi:putative O-methyltransferase [compost metagenome]|uniref:O-methyltransferase n=1 Tax=Paenibacillus rhizolycopersici TaxID=2780073 RepID=A0ABS2HCB0_9BACL|nr:MULTISPECIES: O-methyltransferase [Paenibacillus]MBM6997449.1 O-methyltransferase [Paenibacillus rhizolycopersici]GIP47027.1 O-methyltransferase [Paenibacillus sp. J53TS2]